MDIKMNDRSGVTLKTAGKYCTEDIAVTPNFDIGITPTGSIEITENGTYDVTDKASAVVNVAGSGGETAEVVTKYGYSGTTPVPNTGTISNIYFNTSMSTEEVKTAIAGAGLTFFDFEGLTAYAIAIPTVDGEPTSALLIVDYSSMIGEANAFVIADFFTQAMYFVGSELLGSDLGFTGWNTELVASGGAIAVTGELISGMADMGISSIGAQNEAILSVVSASGGPLESITLTGEYDGTGTINITENGTTDITTLLNENKLPLKVNVNIPNLLIDRITNSFTEITAKDIEGATQLSDYAFAGCSKLTSIEIPSGVTSIKESAFQNCYELTSIEIPDTVTSIGPNAFAGCSSLTSITIPYGVTRISIQTFQRCSALTSIEIPNSVTEIYSNAFAWCTALTSIEIPNSVTYIGPSAFMRCSSLTSIKIPNGVTSIENSAFSSCTACLLYDFSTHTTVPTLDYTSAFSGINANAKIVVPDSLYDSWVAATNWSTYASYIVKASEYTG